MGLISSNFFTSGCMVCGKELLCITDKPVRAKCYYCGKEEAAYTFCMEGHYVCHDCHRDSVLEHVKKLCYSSNSTDPVELMLMIYDLPNINMNGPEYHSIVPAALVTAFMNSTNQKDVGILNEAVERGKTLAGGMCGTHGACGACIGVGIAYSIIYKNTPYSKEVRGRANQITGLALEAIGRFGGPRCCKRDSMTAVMVATKNFGCFDKSNFEYVCRQYRANNMCIGEECPYHPTLERI